MSTKIIGIAGQMQAGKDTTADNLAEILNKRTEEKWKRISFALPIKLMVCDTFGVDLDFIEKWKVINENPPDFQMTMRETLIFIGDGFRKMRPSVWIDKAIQKLSHPAICSDCRYINELITLQKHGGFKILVWRPGHENNLQNGSEAQMRPLVDLYSKTDIDGIVPHSFRESEACKSVHGADLIDAFLRNDSDVPSLVAKIQKLIPVIEGKYGK